MCISNYCVNWVSIHVYMTCTRMLRGGLEKRWVSCYQLKLSRERTFHHFMYMHVIGVQTEINTQVCMSVHCWSLKWQCRRVHVHVHVYIHVHYMCYRLCVPRFSVWLRDWNSWNFACADITPVSWITVTCYNALYTMYDSVLTHVYMYNWSPTISVSRLTWVQFEVNIVHYHPKAKGGGMTRARQNNIDSVRNNIQTSVNYSAYSQKCLTTIVLRWSLCPDIVQTRTVQLSWAGLW